MTNNFWWPYQNPSYPEDQDMTPDEMEAGARAASMARAQSPNPLVCKIDGVWSSDDPFHAHDYTTCMNYRHANVIGDDEPWSNWWLMEDAQFVPRPPIPPAPAGVIGWQLRASAPDPTVVLPKPPPPITPPAKAWQTIAAIVPNVDAPNAWAYVDVWNTGWNGWTLFVYIDPSVINQPTSGFGLRVSLMGICTINKLFVGPFAAGGTWEADTLYQLTFGGNTVVTMDGSVTVVSDPLMTGIDLSNGLILSCYFDPGGDGTLASTYSATSPGWQTGFIYGDYSTDIVNQTIDGIGSQPEYGSTLLLAVEGFYLPPPPATVV